MLRTGLGSNNAFVMAGVGYSSSNQKAVFRRRLADGATTPTSSYGSNFSGSLYFKLVRSGASITGYTSTDNTNWGSPMTGSPVTLTGTPPDLMYAGIAVAQGGGATCSTSTTVTVDTVTITNP